MERDDVGSFPAPSSLLAAGIFLAFAFGLIIFGMSWLGRQDVPPFQVTGCYSAPGAPDIFVDHHSLYVRQASPIVVPYKLENHKGWTLTLDKWLNFRRQPNGTIEIVEGPDFGEFLFLSRDGVVEDPKPGFDLINREDGAVVHYSPTGDTCRG